MNPVPVVVAEQSTSFLQDMAIFMNDGGIFMWIILFVWAIGMAISLERFKTLFLMDINGESLMNIIKKHVLLNEVVRPFSFVLNQKHSCQPSFEVV